MKRKNFGIILLSLTVVLAAGVFIVASLGKAELTQAEVEAQILAQLEPQLSDVEQKLGASEIAVELV